MPPVLSSTIPEQILFDEEHCVLRDFSGSLEKTVFTVPQKLHKQGLFHARHVKTHACFLHTQDTVFKID